MRKITKKLLLTLATAGLPFAAAGAQDAFSPTTGKPVTEVSQITAGWYQLVSTASNEAAAFIGQYVYTLDAPAMWASDDPYPASFMATPTADNVASTYVHITPSGENFIFMLPDGSSLTDAANGTRTPTASAIRQASDGHFQLASYWRPFTANGITIFGKAAGGESNTFDIIPVDLEAAGVTPWAVRIVGATYTGTAKMDFIKDLVLAYSGDGAKGARHIYNHGTLFMAQGAVPATDGLTLMSHVSGVSVPDNVVYTVDEQSHTVTACIGMPQEVCHFSPVTDFSSWTEGWYQVRMTAYDNVARHNNTGRYFRNVDEDFKQNNTNWYALEYMNPSDITADNQACTFVYIKKSGANYVFQSANGHYTGGRALSYRQENAVPFETKYFGHSVGKYWSIYNAGGADHVGQSSGQGNTTYEFSRVDLGTVGVKPWRVVFHNITEASLIGLDAQLRYTGEATNNKGLAKVYANGVFFLAEGVTPQAGDFEIYVPEGSSVAEELENADISIDIDGSGEEGVINVTRNTASTEERDALLSAIETVLAQEGPGTPVNGTAQKAALQEAYSAITDKTATMSMTTYNNLHSLLLAYGNLTEVIMPEDGKAYTLTNVQMDGTRRTLYMDENGLQIGAAGAEAAEGSVFVCRKVGDKYVFVNGTTGNYLIWKGNDGGANGNSGHQEAYSSNQCDFIVGSSNTYTGTSANAFGAFYLQAHRSNGSENGVYVITSAGVWNKWSTGTGIDPGFSTLIRLEEVAYPNVKTIGEAGLYTYSLPFAATVPEGITAYTMAVKEAAEGNLEAAPTHRYAAGETLPKATGVLLDCQTGTHTFLPAIEAGETAEDNDLTAVLFGETVDTGINAYILSGSGDDVAFRRLTATGDRTISGNKAYLVVPQGTEAARLTISLRGGVTGIAGAAEADSTDAPVYDLSGRRVFQLGQGVYIRNGRKFIVK